MYACPFYEVCIHFTAWKIWENEHRSGHITRSSVSATAWTPYIPIMRTEIWDRECILRCDIIHTKLSTTWYCLPRYHL